MKRLIFGLAAVIAMSGAATAGEVPLYPAQDCSKETGQMGLNQCFGANLDAANAALGKSYAMVMTAQTGPKGKEQLKDVERAWVAFKDKECTLETASDEGGSIQPMDYAECEIELTDARIREMQKILGCTGSVSACKPH